MSNLFLDSSFSEHIRQGALAVELWDAPRLQRLARRVDVTVDAPPPTLPTWLRDQDPSTTVDDLLPRLPRRGLYLHGIFYGPSLTKLQQLTLRINDRTRYFVPRRIQYPIVNPAPDPRVNGSPPHPAFVIRPTYLYPGAAYSYSTGATGIRGVVQYGAGPTVVRWARIEAFNAGTNELVGRAHGDDRGEFLLLLGSNAGPQGAAVDPTIPIDIVVWAPPVPAPATYATDPLGDVVVEIVGAAVPDSDPLVKLPKLDSVAAGAVPPTGYTSKTFPGVNVPLAQVVTNLPAFSF
jgi:hypothetical protein